MIQSSLNLLQQHHIIKTGETCTDSSCLKCQKCNICIHTFHCSCIDNIIKANICKHIQACALEFLSYEDYNATYTVETNITEQNIINKKKIIIYNIHYLELIDNFCFIYVIYNVHLCKFNNIKVYNS